MTRVAALGDAHLGRQYYPKTTSEGINQRERDFEDSFEAAIDLALSLQPDAFLWLGDIFDYPRPTYRSFRVAQRALTRIREHGIPLVAISGNHDTPRLPGTGSPYAVLSDSFPEMHLAYRMTYESFDIAGLRIHAVPQTLSVADALEALNAAKVNRSQDRVNLLITHPRVPQVEPGHSDINEIEVDAAAIQADLALLGHYHFHVKVRSGIWYAGSTDTFSFADNPEKPKGIILADTTTGDVTHHEVPGRRPMVFLEDVTAYGLSPAELQAVICERVAQIPVGGVGRLVLEGVDPQAYRLVDPDVVAGEAAHALHFRIEPRYGETSVRVADLPSRDTIGDRWARYIELQDLTGYDREHLRQHGGELIQAAIDEA